LVFVVQQCNLRSSNVKALLVIPCVRQRSFGTIYLFIYLFIYLLLLFFFLLKALLNWWKYI
ncbi:MAG: hypothetical protein N7Q72_06430, partial [Spiroplasma sp. Tabriz.8]|nr:hypothetical protein [Spiroplasma sp. Tabriz.8]